jgi:hypothetical protein
MGPRTILVVAEPFDADAVTAGRAMDADAVTSAIARGLRAADASLEVDCCPLDGPARNTGEPTVSAAEPAEPAALRARLDAMHLDARMRGARTVVIAAARLDRQTLLRRGAVFEVATRARQGGVPCCAIAAHNALDPFEARVLDLQVVLEADTPRGLKAAAGRLVGLM